MLAGIDWELWLTPVLLLGGGILVGLLLESLLMGTLRVVLRRTLPDVGNALTAVPSGILTGLFIVLGMDLAADALPNASPASLALVHKLLFILATVVVIRLVSGLAVMFVRFIVSRNDRMRALPDTSIFENVIHVLVYIVGFLVLLQTLGVSVMPILTALGVGGLAISLALQDTLANVFAGVNMIMAGQIKIGDFVKLQEGAYEGFVQDIGWRTTVIRQLNNNLVIVPNSKMASGIILNTTLPLPEMALLVEVSVSYNSDLHHVERVTIETGKEILSSTDGAIPDFEPFIRYHTFGDSGICFTVILRVHTWVDQYLVKHRFIQRLHERFGEENIEIPYPQRVLHMQTG